MYVCMYVCMYMHIINLRMYEHPGGPVAGLGGVVPTARELASQ